MTKNNRRALDWKKVKGPKATAALAISTAFGAGLFPVAPGTMGTLMAVPIVYFTAHWEWPLRVALWLAITLAGIWSAKVFDEVMDSSDNQNIVIDEVIGLGITAWTAGTNWVTIFAAFVVFRAFDIIKPPPVRQLDQWSKIKASQKNGSAAAWWGGFGVIADDILAALEALAVIVILQKLGVLP